MQSPVANISLESFKLSYPRSAQYPDSLVDLVLRFDTLCRASRTSKKYYWALPGRQRTPSTRTFTTWLQICLYHLHITPRPQVSWSSYSLRMGAASEAAAIGVQEYRILTWGIGLPPALSASHTWTLACKPPKICSIFSATSSGPNLDRPLVLFKYISVC